MTLEDVDFIEITSMTVRGSRRRTTVPKKVFEKLHLLDKDKLRWTTFKDGRVFLEKVDRSRK